MKGGGEYKCSKDVQRDPLIYLGGEGAQKKFAEKPSERS